MGGDVPAHIWKDRRWDIDDFTEEESSDNEEEDYEKRDLETVSAPYDIGRLKSLRSAALKTAETSPATDTATETAVGTQEHSESEEDDRKMTEGKGKAMDKGCMDNNPSDSIAPAGMGAECLEEIEGNEADDVPCK